MILIETTSHDPYWNLAAEEYVFNHLPKDKTYFMLWQNANAVIVGRYQNTFAEVNADFVTSNHILVARRLSGGGAVYHDLGNVNYTFITDPGNIKELNLHAFCKPLKQALRKIGVPAEISGRNDVLIKEMKCSGCSQYIQENRVMHHGCVMFDTDLSVLSGALNYRPEKYISKGKKSIRSRVTNIAPFLDDKISVSEFKELLKKYMSDGQPLDPYHFTSADFAAIDELRNSKYCTWDWNYGLSPAYDTCFSRYVEGCGFVEMSANVVNSVLHSLHIRGDFFGSGKIEDLQELLSGSRMLRECLEEKLFHFPLNTYLAGISKEQFIDILLGKE